MDPGINKAYHFMLGSDTVWTADHRFDLKAIFLLMALFQKISKGVVYIEVFHMMFVNLHFMATFWSSSLSVKTTVTTELR